METVLVIYFCEECGNRDSEEENLTEEEITELCEKVDSGEFDMELGEGLPDRFTKNNYICPSCANKDCEEL